MLLKTFLKHLCVQPEGIRHDAYEDKDIMTFKPCDGYFPYIEFQTQPKDKVQDIYFDVLNWSAKDSQSRYVTSTRAGTTDFMKFLKLQPDNASETIDQVNERLQAFYMLCSE